MSEKCEQGDDLQKQIVEDRLNHLQSISKIVTSVKLLEQSVSTLVKTSLKEIKDCRVERNWLHKRINKIWITGVGTLITVIGWFITNHLKGH